MIRRPWSRTAIAILLGAALAAAMPFMPAVGEQSPPKSPPESPPQSPPQSPPVPVVEIGTQAQLQADGAAIIVPVRATCGPGATQPGFLAVRVSQRVGDWIAVGSGTLRNVACDGEVQEVRVPTLATKRPFRLGVAFAVANLVVRFPTGGRVHGQHFREIEVVPAQQEQPTVTDQEH
jgi:hypothetical protein